MAAKAKQQTEEIDVLEISQGRIECCILGRTPLILNRMSEKARHELLLPRGRKTAADKAAGLKHHPLEEYRASPYRAQGEAVPTRLLLPATAFKAALRDVALDMPGATKSQLGRLTYVEGDYVPIYGVPRLAMHITRSADMNRTPDVRTRAILPRWGCRVAVVYVRPILREKTVVDLLAAAGLMRGVGDWRPEKGSGNHGQFELVSEDDPRYLEVLRQGRAAQDAALEEPEAYDAESAELYTWFLDETQRRGIRVAS